MSAPPLATPIQSLPTAAAPPPAHDPSVTDVLNEMESVVSQAESYQQNPLPPSFAQQMAMPTMSMPMPPPPPPATAWVHPENAKRAVAAMVIAIVLFYPTGLFPAIYHKFSKLGFLESYDLFVRVFLLGALFYTILTFVPL